MSQQIARLQGDLGNLVQVLVEGLTRRLSAYHVDAVGYTILHVCQGVGPISIRDLRRLVPIDPGLISRATTLLEDKGLLEKRRPRDDRRLVRLIVTEHGAALMPELTERVHEFYAVLLKGISQRQLVGCNTVMEQMIAAGQEAEGPPARSPESPADSDPGTPGMAGETQNQSIESHTGRLQGNVTTLVNVLFRGIRQRVSPFDLAVVEYSVFTTCFANESITISGLARRVPIDIGRISRIVSKLEDRELVRKVRPVDDRRVVNVEMTSQGRALALELMGGVQEHYANVFRKTSERELTDLVDFIERMTANAGSANGEPEGGAGSD
ncbi:MAG: MarR family transcriptional regulator [Chloroflexi bacterium]|nr:MarR family transcriptional regulator [Chloroflexota bacterium]MCY3939212.1 MarR family transcriptional regulator [Chloroflexota bacterium]